MPVWHDGNRVRVQCSVYKAREMLSPVNPCGLLAAEGARASSHVALAVAVIFIGFLLVSYILLLMKQYKRCPPNRLLVIYGQTGSGGGPRLIHGGAAFVVPLLQSYAYLSLEPIDVELSLSSQSGTKHLGFPLPQKFTVAISTVSELAQTAAVRLLGLTVTEIRSRAEEVIGSALRRNIAAAGRTESEIDQDAFYAKLESEIGSGLKPLGLELVSLKRA
jgi:flotillin